MAPPKSDKDQSWFEESKMGSQEELEHSPPPATMRQVDIEPLEVSPDKEQQQDMGGTMMEGGQRFKSGSQSLTNDDFQQTNIPYKVYESLKSSILDQINQVMNKAQPLDYNRLTEGISFWNWMQYKLGITKDKEEEVSIEQLIEEMSLTLKGERQSSKEQSAKRLGRADKLIK